MKMKQLTELLLERNNISYGCMMAQLPNINEDYQSNFRPFTINKSDIYDDKENEFGIEMEPHVTILYGFEPDVREQDIGNWVKENVDKPIEMLLKEITLFENDEKPYDVVKWDVESDDLSRLNESLRSIFPYKSDFPDYNPHATIMYSNKGQGKNYCYKPDNPMNLATDILKFSKPNGEKLFFKI